MIRDRRQLEELEAQTLATYARKSRDSRGRAYPEDEPDYRTAFQRDRDRILHTTAFRRLEYKTQVFVNYEGDYYRTRLTHTLEVAQIGRTIARALAVNEDLTEAICLAHDLGHPPFGHAGERALHALMAGHGGFDHNRQALRIVDVLEQRYPDFPGLNLTWEVREGIAKHEARADISSEAGFDPQRRGLLEAQIPDVADEIAYNAHDLDDGLRAGILMPEMLEELALWHDLKGSIGWDGRHFDDLVRYRLIRRLIGLEVTDLIYETAQRIRESGVGSPEEVQALGYNLVGFSPDLAAKNTQLKEFLQRYLYNHYRLIRMQTKAERFISDLFHAYISQPAQLPANVQARISDEASLYRVVCDYIAGMTDRFALEEWQKLFDPFVRA